MKKVFLKSMLLLCALIVGSSSVWAAADVTYDFTGSGWTVSKGTLSNGTVSFTGAGSDNFKMNDGYFIMGKTDAYITFPTYSNAVSKIVVTGRSGASGSTKMNIYVGSTAVSTETTGCTGTNTYNINSSYQAAGTTYVLKVTSNHNAQVTKIEVYYVSLSPSITLNENAFNHTKDAVDDGAITVTYNNIASANPELIYYEADGETEVEDSEYDWLYADFNASKNIEYLLEANTGSPRKAYMKVHQIGSSVYSELITISQASGIDKPSFSTAAGAIEAGTSITLSQASATSIRYTLDGSEPTKTTGTVYSDAIEITTPTTIKAIAIVGDDVSDVATAAYTINVAAPSFSLNAGSYLTGTTFTLTSSGNTIYYTTGNSNPTSSSTQYTDPIELLSGKTTYKAIAYDTYGNASSVTQKTITGVDPASLPFSWTGTSSNGKDNLAAQTGVALSLASDYADSNAPYRLKFDGTSKYVLVFTDEKPATVSFTAKLFEEASTGSKMKIQASTNGVDFTDIQEFTIKGKANATFEFTTSTPFAPTVRVVKLAMSNKDKNVGVGNITVSANRTITLSSDCTDGTGKYYATYSCNKAFVVPEGITVSAVKMNEGHLDLSATYSTGDVVAANTGVLVSSETADEKTVVLSSEAGTTIDGNLLYPGDVTAEEMAAAHPSCKYYKLALERDGEGEGYVANTAGFYWGAEGGAAFASSANKAYLAVPTGASAPSHFMFNEEVNGATNIENIEANEKAVKFIENGRILIKKNGIVYDALGRIVK